MQILQVGVEKESETDGEHRRSVAQGKVNEKLMGIWGRGSSKEIVPFSWEMYTFCDIC